MREAKEPGAVTLHGVVMKGIANFDQDFDGLAVLRKAAEAWGVGRALIARIEPEDEAWRHGDTKYLFGHLYEPVVRYGETGYTKNELHLVCKAEWMPEGKHSLTQLNHGEMREFIELTEKWLREQFPKCFEEAPSYESNR